MRIHGCVVFRQRFKEIHHLFDFREGFNSRFYHFGNFLQIYIPGQRFFQIRLGQAVKTVEIHGLNVLPVHPFKLGIVEYGRGLGHMAVVKFLRQLLQGENFLIIFRAPAKKGHKVHDSFR